MSNYYMNGNTARKTRTAPGPERRQVRVVEPTGRKQGKNQKMSLGYVLFMSVALAFMGVMLVFYIGLQSEVKSTVKTISQKESELNDLRNSNDEMESRVKSDVDLEEIKEKPSKRWETAVTVTITVVVTALVTFAITKLGL